MDEYALPEPNHGVIDAWREIMMIQRQQAKTPGVAFNTFSRGNGTEPTFVPQEATKGAAS